MLDAAARGAEHIIVGLGGSATCDAGVGMLRAVRESQGFMHYHPCFTIAADVPIPLYGEQGAARLFAPQKGATPEMVQQLDDHAKGFAEVSAKLCGFDRSGEAGAGAAGGLGYAFMQYLDAECKSGMQLLLDTIHFDELVKDADLVITGEGAADRQTLMGKLPMGILHHAGQVPVCLIAGRIDHREELLQAGFAHVACIHPEGIALEEAMRKEVATRHICDTVSKAQFFAPCNSKT